MTDDKTKNEGAPSAEPDAIRDGAGHGPADPGRITIDVEALENITPGQLAEYAREHPEELPQMIDGLKKTFKALGNNSKSNVTNALSAGLIRTDEGEGTADYLPESKTEREIEKTLKAASLKPLREIENDDYMKIIQKRLKDVFSSISRVSAILAESAPGIEKLDALFTEIDELEPFIADIMKKDPGTQGKTIDDLLEDLPPTAAIYIFKGLESPADQEGEELPAELPEEEHATIRKIIYIIRQAREARDAADLIASQNAGRALRRQLKENAEKHGAIMELREDGNLPIFSAKKLWNAFAPGRISQMGKLAPSAINKTTGRIEKLELEKGDILPLPAADISYKAFMLLNSIMANSVDNIREFFISDGAIRFYVKGVLDQLGVDARIHGNPQQIELDPQQIELDRHTKNRKTAGALYLEEQLKPLLLFVGTTPDGSRYSVLNYDGYDIESDTMIIRSPYLYQLWITTQEQYSKRKKAKEQRIAEGKRPLKDDVTPLELNTLFKGAAYKEDDAVLEIAAYITNVLLTAGKGAHKTEIKYRTLIDHCPRLRERLEEIDRYPKAADGKKINKTAHYNTALRKIARAYTLIMSPDKCDALKNFEFKKFTPTKEKDGKMEFIPPTKSTLDWKIYIEWSRIDPNNS